MSGCARQSRPPGRESGAFVRRRNAENEEGSLSKEPAVERVRSRSANHEIRALPPRAASSSTMNDIVESEHICGLARFIELSPTWKFTLSRRSRSVKHRNRVATKQCVHRRSSRRSMCNWRRQGAFGVGRYVSVPADRPDQIRRCARLHHDLRAGRRQYTGTTPRRGRSSRS